MPYAAAATATTATVAAAAAAAAADGEKGEREEMDKAAAATRIASPCPASGSTWQRSNTTKAEL